ncbi:MAG: hypothetical protein HPY50_00095 [Firmicutes bacterium]|nr:hypothetical protein [Bacillota bacterium]
MTRMEAFKLNEEATVERKAEAAKVFELKRKEEAVCKNCQEKLEPNWTYCPFCFEVVEDPAPTKAAPKTYETNNYRYVTRECPECRAQVNQHFTYCPTCWTVIK